MDKSSLAGADITLERMRTFVRVAERGNLSAVARELRVGQSTVTRHLHELESAIGLPLLSRTTRSVTLTEEGRRYYQHCTQILRLVDQASDDMRDARGAPAGLVRVSCTAALGVLHVSRLIFAFQDQYPDIQIDLSLTDERIDLVEAGVDVAIRLGALTDSNMKRRALGFSQRVLVAAPAWLATQGELQTPADLIGLEGIRMINIASSDTLSLRGPDGATHSVPSTGRLRVDHGLASRAAMAAGRGLSPTHLWLVDDLLASGVVVRVLPDYTLPPMPLNLLIVPERAAIVRVRLLVDYLAREMARLPGIMPTPALAA
ncbi:DNA-binding transcriptional LysR family regulator [Silvimonas terrae]|uniref:DNA-binding transcriptional LysR family regulator n=1 Tax=Silvimonas terrae TaxID=300266 RepID=A0A840RFF9_9NEIS|nr:LysR family transcriptional regulator [Silvimonas terrae]MBB5191767.1 DNA-binding transcriptional LysR family regulator [Silvimonas terrae]